MQEASVFKAAPIEEIKGIFLGTNIGREYQIVIIQNNEETLKRLEYETLELTEKDFISTKPSKTSPEVKSESFFCSIKNSLILF